jgi:MOSC domain-containing protein YiiM
MITLAGIAYKQSPRGRLQELASAALTPEHGLAGDCRGRPGKRQITILSYESWRDACNELGVEVAWTARRANLLLQGVRFGADDVGRILLIGTARLLITRETDPCARMDAAQPGLQAALRPAWRGGVCCRVVQGGQITRGDIVSMALHDPH